MTAEHPPTHRTTTRCRVAAVAVAAAALTGGIAVADVVAASSSDATADRRGHDLAVMELNCEVVDRDVASIGCRWSTLDAVAGYRLVRVAVGSDTGRQTVARFDDPTINSYIDSPVRRGLRYRYAVLAYDPGGRLVGASRPATVGVPAPDDDPRVEQLRLNCTATSTTTVRCAGSVPTEPARTLTLWRSVDGGEREAIVVFPQPFPESYGDVVRDGTAQVRYAIIATDGDGRIVARSRAEHVEMPTPPTTPTRPVDVRPVPARVDVPVDAPVIVETVPTAVGAADGPRR